MTIRNILVCAYRLFVATLFALSVTYPATEAVAENDSPDVTQSPANEGGWVDTSLEDLEEALAEARAELVAARRERIQVSHDLQQNDEKARELLAEMDELRRRLNEKELEWKAWLAEQEEISKLERLEEKKLRKLRELTAVIEDRQQRSETEAE